MLQKWIVFTTQQRCGLLHRAASFTTKSTKLKLCMIASYSIRTINTILIFSGLTYVFASIEEK